MSLKMENLRKCFEAGISQGAKYVGVLICIKGNPTPELIVNTKESFDGKLEYYEKTYNEDLTHKHADGIRIIGFTHAEDLQYIESFLMTNADLQTFGYGIAYNFANAGHKIARDGWNTKGLFVKMQIPDERSKMTKPYLYMNIPQGLSNQFNSDSLRPRSVERVPWQPSQTDMNATDWRVVD